jgi:hypothetical protein
MNDRYNKHGETRETTDSDIMWLRGLLRYVRNAEIVTPGPNGLPNITTMFGGFTFGFQNRLHLIFNSYSSTDHAMYIEQTNAQAAEHAEAPRPNTALTIANTFSKEVTLLMEGYARLLEDPAEVNEGKIAYDATRRLKQLPRVDLAPKTPDDPPRSLYAAKVLSAKTQGERFSVHGNHVGEGHPIVDLESLRGFETLPPLPAGRVMPLDKQALQRFLEQ